LEEFKSLDEEFEAIRAGDEHFALLSAKRDKVFGWGFNSHHQLATIDAYKVLAKPDVIYTSEDGETIKFVECGKLSTCVVTGRRGGR
jgi:alpha-tubulin suppressor-like RCC1 family protein